MHPRDSRSNHPIASLLALLATADGTAMNPTKREQTTVSEMVVEKTWEIPANGGKSGPVTLVVRMPNVLIIDSRGRHILVAPEQADLVSTKMGEVADWIRNAAAG
jgi:hypothetical protein